MSLNLKVLDPTEIQGAEEAPAAVDERAVHSLNRSSSWTIPQFRAGDLVEVKGKEEILATLDETGCIDGMPFMPEMLAFCGKQLVIDAVAHKTCDTAWEIGSGRRLNDTVHLRGSRCDGSAHGGCEAECLLFWKSAWLKPVSQKRDPIQLAPAVPPESVSVPAILQRATCVIGATDPVLYSCQATRLHEATQPLPWWDVRQYFLDVVTGNRTLGHTLRVTILAALRATLRKIPFGYRPFRFLTEATHRMLTGRDAPRHNGQVPDGQRTPATNLGLQQGELVRIRSLTDIERTLDKRSHNRGMAFDPNEMGPFCGREATVRRKVTKIIEERTGKMLQMKGACVVLNDVYCKSEYSRCRLNCPRAIYSYWREAWLERVPTASE